MARLCGTSGVMKKLFGTDGIRGTANTGNMTAETALRIGAAVGRYFKRDAGSAVPIAQVPEDKTGTEGKRAS